MAKKVRPTMHVTKDEYNFLKGRYEGECIKLLDGRNPMGYRIEVASEADEDDVFDALDKYRLSTGSTAVK